MKTVKIIACIICLLCIFKIEFVLNYFQYNTYTNNFAREELIVYNIAGLTEKGNEAFKIVAAGIISFITMIVLAIKEGNKKETDTQQPPKE